MPDAPLPAATPSLALGIQPVPRLPPLRFSAGTLPLDWFGGDRGTTATWNALSVLAEAGEAAFMQSGRWLVERAPDAATAEELTRFIQQEACHSTLHRRLNGVLAEQGLPVEALRRETRALLAWLLEEGGPHRVAAMSVAGEQAVGEMGHASLSHPELMAPAEPGVRALWMWHWYEEVEHQAALYDGWMAVLRAQGAGQERRQRVLGVANLVVLLGILWPAASVAMARAAGGTASPLGWTPVLRQLFGARGLLRGALRNLVALLGATFHPFDRHDPRPLLAAWRGRAVQSDWERAVRLPRRFGTAASGPAPRAGWRELVDLLRFAGRTAGAALRLLRGGSGCRDGGTPTPRPAPARGGEGAPPSSTRRG